MIWQVHVYDACNGSQGFHYFGSKKDALTFCKRQYPDFPVVDDFMALDCCVLSSVKTPKTKWQVMCLLAAWGSHPDNG